MNNDIANILNRLRVIESDLTPVSVKKGQNKQQKSVPQLPALFKPENISPVLSTDTQKKPLGKNMFGDSKEPARNALAERMASIDEDMLSRVKNDLAQYLDYLENKKGDDIDEKKKRLVRQAAEKIQDRNPAKPGDQQEYEETQEPMLSGTAQMTPVSVGESQEPAKIIALEDGTCLECWGDQDRGFEIRHGGRVLPSRFGTLDEAEMAVEMFRAHRRSLPQDPNQDYLEEA
jgi:hypothetical protein